MSLELLLGLNLIFILLLGNKGILTIFFLPIHGHGRSFHLFASPSISFASVLQYSLYRYFTSFTKIIAPILDSITLEQ
jgi:hypothetical protein